VLAIHTRRLILAILLPGLFLVLTHQYTAAVHHLVVPLHSALPFVPYFLVIAGLVLAWGYHNGREFSLFLTLGISYWALRNYIWLPNLHINEQSILFACLSLLIPLNFLVHAVMPDRGVLRWQIAKRLGIIVVQIAPVVWWLKHPDGALQDALRYALWNNPWPKAITLSQPGIVTLGLAIIVLLAQLIRHGNVLHGGVIMALVGAMMGLNSVGHPTTSILYFSIASASLLTAIVLNSYNLAYLDELTRLPARRALKQQLLALPKHYCIAMVDIDHFKKFNDTFGHDVGDQVLRRVGAQLRNISGAKVFRYGGEEFAILIHHKDIYEALVQLDALREHIAKTPFYLRHKRRPRKRPERPDAKRKSKGIRITVSIGAAAKTERHNSPWEVIKSADKALYAAKRAGRNRVRG
jgi:diguanylate cyclase (GGDEF)-like protein